MDGMESWMHANCDYEFLIKVTFMWEFDDEDKRINLFSMGKYRPFHHS